MSFVKNLLGSTKLPFGLDIGYTSVRAVQLEKRRDKLIHLVGYNETPLEKDVFLNNGEINTSALSSAIQTVTEESKLKPITSKRVVCALPESDVFVKVLQLPKMSDNELEEVLKLEVDKIVPFAISELYLDWERVKIGNEKENEKDSILVVAASQKLIQNYMEAIKKAGLEVVALEIEPAAVCRALIKGGESQKEAIVVTDIGADITSITVYDFNSIQLAGSTRIAGNSISESLGLYLKISKEKAEDIKRKVINSDKNLEPKLFNSAVKPVLTQLSNEISRSIDYYTNYAKNSRTISKIIFCGGNAHLPGLVEFFEKRFNIKSEIGNPWANVTTYPLKALPKLKASIYATAIGLALREIVE